MQQIIRISRRRSFENLLFFGFYIQKKFKTEWREKFTNDYKSKHI